MAIINATKYDPELAVEKQLEKSMNPEELERWKRNPKPHYCDAPSLQSGEYGPGTVWTCDDCHSQKKVVHLGIKQSDDSLPLAWRNLGNR